MARKRIKKFGALVGMIAVTTLLMLYFLAVPVFWGATSGKVFSFVWLMLALVMLAAFGQKVFEGKRKRVLAPVYVFREAKVTVSGQGQGKGKSTSTASKARGVS